MSPLIRQALHASSIPEAQHRTDSTGLASFFLPLTSSKQSCRAMATVIELPKVCPFVNTRSVAGDVVIGIAWNSFFLFHLQTYLKNYDLFRLGIHPLWLEERGA